MEIQEFIKLIGAIISFILISFGIFYVKKDINVSGEIDISGLIAGKIKTGSAGILLIFFGTIIICTLIAKGSSRKIFNDYQGGKIVEEKIYIDKFK